MQSCHATSSKPPGFVLTLMSPILVTSCDCSLPVQVSIQRTDNHRFGHKQGVLAANTLDAGHAVANRIGHFRCVANFQECSRRIWQEATPLPRTQKCQRAARQDPKMKTAKSLLLPPPCTRSTLKDCLAAHCLESQTPLTQAA